VSLSDMLLSLVAMTVGKLYVSLSEMFQSLVLVTVRKLYISLSEMFQSLVAVEVRKLYMCPWVRCFSPWLQWQSGNCICVPE
jgi:hypothetical protein